MDQTKRSLRNATGSVNSTARGVIAKAGKKKRSLGGRLSDAIGARLIGRSKVTGQY